MCIPACTGQRGVCIPVCTGQGEGVYPSMHWGVYRSMHWAGVSTTPSLGRHPPPETATAADGTHPTGMHSFFSSVQMLMNVVTRTVTTVTKMQTASTPMEVICAPVIQVRGTAQEK